MNKTRRFFRDYLMVPVLMPILSAGVAVYTVNQEAENYSYLSYASAWPHANEHTRQLIREAMADGKMTQWESTEIFRAVMDDVRWMTTCPAGADCRDLTTEQARDKLQEAMRR